MKLKAAIRYQTVELVQSAAAFFLIVGVIIAIIFLPAFSQGAHVMVSSMGSLPFVLMVLLALSVFSGDVRFLLRMGLTRAQVLASTAASFAAACLFLALVETVCVILVPFWSHEHSLFLGVYGAEHGPLLDFLFMLLGCAAASAVGLALAALQMRFGTRRVVLFVAALGVLWFMPFRNVDAIMAFSNGLSWAFGFGEGASLANPFITFVLVAAIGAAVAWVVVRRLEVR